MRLFQFVAVLIPGSIFASSGHAAPPERPDIILIMVDDMGFSDLGYHGGEIDTPNLDALAGGGVRFSQFYNSGRCCPTRATLMTGLHPHQTGIGHMTNPPNSTNHDYGVEGYRGFLNRKCVTVAELLKESGYATLMTGKWHLGNNAEDRWPLQRGFEKFYGCIPGATRFFYPEAPRGMTSGNTPVEIPESTTGEAFYTTDAFTDHAIRFLREEKKAGDRPAFLYLAYTAPHWPLQAFEDDIAKYRGKYKIGWDALRRQRLARQVEIGLIDPGWDLSERTPEIPAWESLDEAKQDEMDLKMAVYAAMIDRVDQNIGKLVAYLKESGRYDETLIFFLSDNGGCQEGGMFGRGNFEDIERRNLERDNSYGEAWANASNTPFRLYKHFAHEGGTATPFFMHWPAGIVAQPEWFGSPSQLIDVMPTVLDVAGATYPETFHGNALPALDGVSLRPAFGGKPLVRSEPIFVEHENNAFVRDGDWKLVGREVAAKGGVVPARWELYNLAVDRTETRNLASEQPGRVAAMAAQWEAWAERVQVYPKAKETPAASAPSVAGRELRITATVRDRKPQGVVVSHGGVAFGYALHFVDGRPAFSVRNGGTLTELVAEKPVKGLVTVGATLNRKMMALFVGDEEVAARPSPGLLRRQPLIGFHVGEDLGDPVGNYSTPNPFNGKIQAQAIKVWVPE